MTHRLTHIVPYTCKNDYVNLYTQHYLCINTASPRQVGTKIQKNKRVTWTYYFPSHFWEPRRFVDGVPMGNGTSLQVNKNEAPVRIGINRQKNILFGVDFAYLQIRIQGLQQPRQFLPGYPFSKLLITTVPYCFLINTLYTTCQIKSKYRIHA